MAAGDFTTFERWALGLVGVAAGAGAVALWLHPGTRKVLAPACPPGQWSVDVSADPTSLILVLLGISALLLVIALNGRRLASLKLPGGIEATSLEQEKKAVEQAVASKVNLLSDATPAPSSTDAARPAPPDASPSASVVVGGVDLGVYRLDAVPCAVLSDLLKAKVSDLPRLFAVEFVARKSGRGNHPWLIKFRGDDRIWKVAYGGQGKDGPTVAELA